jgi:hypothetical protein
MLDRPDRRRPATARTKRCRRRAAAGLMLVSVEVDAAILDLLCSMNGLEEREA